MAKKFAFFAGVTGIACFLTLTILQRVTIRSIAILAISTILLLLSFEGSAVWLASLASTAGRATAAGAHHAAPHARAVTRGGRWAISAALQKFLNDVPLWGGVGFAIAAAILFLLAFLGQDWGLFHKGLFAVFSATFCFATKWGWFKPTGKFLWKNKTKSWFCTSVALLVLALVHGWDGARNFALISALLSGITLIKKWKECFGFVKKILSPWLGGKGVKTFLNAWAITGFVLAVGIVEVTGARFINQDILYVGYAVMFIVFLLNNLKSPNSKK